MDSGKEISCELVVASGDATEVFEAAETAFDNVSALVEALVEGMEDDTVGFVGDDGLCAARDDGGAQLIAVVSFVADESRHGRCEREYLGCDGDVSSLTGAEVKNDWPAERIAQAMDFGRPPATRAADGLIEVPPFPPEAQR